MYESNRIENKTIIELKPKSPYNFDANFHKPSHFPLSEFRKKYKNDRILGSIIKKWEGMKPIAANSLYETLIIYIVLQNATVKRSVQMLENLFKKFGKKVKFDGKILSTFWEQKSMESDLLLLNIYFLRIFIFVML